MVRRSVVAAALSVCLSLGPIVAAVTCAQADDYPSHPIIMIVPLAPGGSTDVLARITAAGLSKQLGQPVVVENTSGAGGTIGVTRAERSPPDGYTIVFGQWGTNMANGAIYSLDFDLVKDFEPIALVATQPFMINSRKALPANNLKELIAWLKQNGDKTTEGNSGVGSPSHIAGILLQQTLGLKWQMVPYRSAGLSMQDLVAGTVDIALDAPAVVMPQFQAGTVKILRRRRAEARHRDARRPDHRRSRIAGILFFILARDVGAEGHAQRDDRKTQQGDGRGARRSRNAQAHDRSRAGDLSTRAANAGSAQGFPRGGNRQVVADHQGRRREGRVIPAA